MALIKHNAVKLPISVELTQELAEWLPDRLLRRDKQERCAGKALGISITTLDRELNIRVLTSSNHVLL